jgi:hypothetical protein
LAKTWIGGAQVVYILGYGFDEENSRRIGLDDSLYVAMLEKVAYSLIRSLSAVLPIRLFLLSPATEALSPVPSPPDWPNQVILEGRAPRT